MNEAFFKTTVMGGFNKNEVLDFIDKQDKQFKEREKDLTARNASLERELKEKDKKNGELSKRIEELEGMLQAERDQNADAIEKLHSIGIEAKRANDDFTSDLEKRDAEIASLKEENQRLDEQVKNTVEKSEHTASYASDLENKLAMIDKTQDQIGRALLEAQQTADKIVDTAREKSREIIDKANKDSNSIITKANENVGKINHEAGERLSKLLSFVADYKSRVESTRGEVGVFFETVDAAFESMLVNSQDMLDKYSNAFSQSDANDTDEIDNAENENPEQEAAAVKFDFTADE